MFKYLKIGPYRLVVLLLLAIAIIVRVVLIGNGWPMTNSDEAIMALHALHIYSDYWTCNRLIFLSNERIICSVLDINLSPGQNRYEPYVQIVKQDLHPAYAFDVENAAGISQSKAFTLRFGTLYHCLYLAGYAIYLEGTPAGTS